MQKRARYVHDYLTYGRRLAQAQVRLYQGDGLAVVLVLPVGEDEPLERAREIAAAVLAEQPWLRAYLELHIRQGGRGGLRWFFLTQADLAPGAVRDYLLEVEFRTLRLEAQAPWETPIERRVGKIRRTYEVDWPDVEDLVGEAIPGPIGVL